MQVDNFTSKVIEIIEDDKVRQTITKRFEIDYSEEIKKKLDDLNIVYKVVKLKFLEEM